MAALASASLEGGIHPGAFCGAAYSGLGGQGLGIEQPIDTANHATNPLIDTIRMAEYNMIVSGCGSRG
jgi:hypothetical protein